MYGAGPGAGEGVQGGQGTERGERSLRGGDRHAGERGSLLGSHLRSGEGGFRKWRGEAHGSGSSSQTEACNVFLILAPV